MFSRMSLQFKVILAFLVIIVVLAASSFYQIRSVQHFSGVLSKLVDNDVARQDVLDDIKLQSVQLRNQLLQYQVDLNQGSKVSMAAEKDKFTQRADSLRSSESYYRKLSNADTGKDHRQDVASITNATEDVILKSLAVLEAAAGAPKNQVPKQAQDGLAASQTRLDAAIARVSINEQRAIITADNDADQTVLRLQSIIVGFAIFSTLLALGLGLIVSGWISRSLQRIKKGTEYIANGDFSRPIPVKSNDELGQLANTFNSMAERLKEAYRRQAIAQQRDEAMLTSMGEGLIAIDGDGNIAFINRVAASLLSLPNEAAAVGKPVQQVYDLYKSEGKADKPLPVEQRPSYIAMHTGAALNDLYLLVKADGTKHILNITANPVKLNEQVIGAITVLRDVTKEKEVDRMKTEFISLASHQLRTPLSAIKWFSEMLVSGDVGELQADQLDFARNISASTERMIDLVNALLNISRIESGRIMVDPKPTDLKELVNGITSDLKAKTEEKQQNLVISVHDDLPKINLDPRLTSQVYMNLLTNAIKYTPKGGEISVFISRKGDDIISQVTDNGYGIPVAQQDRVFQKFFRAANAVKVETDGTGLGLYLIKAIVESSGGKIWFKSEEGKGTTFWFSMPVSGMKQKEGEVTLDM
ncbi:MAG TPA: ATP-binding protein [Candidatus Saccharimonadales bacterium]|nr:ATP-binding protein [Candidatus Saccharimonadales bacterium]